MKDKFWWKLDFHLLQPDTDLFSLATFPNTKPVFGSQRAENRRPTWIRDVEQSAGVGVLPVLHRHATATSTYDELHEHAERGVAWTPVTDFHLAHARCLTPTSELLLWHTVFIRIHSKFILLVWQKGGTSKPKVLTTKWLTCEPHVWNNWPGYQQTLRPPWSQLLTPTPNNASVSAIFSACCLPFQVFLLLKISLRGGPLLSLTLPHWLPVTGGPFPTSCKYDKVLTLISINLPSCLVPTLSYAVVLHRNELNLRPLVSRFPLILWNRNVSCNGPPLLWDVCTSATTELLLPAHASALTTWLLSGSIALISSNAFSPADGPCSTGTTGSSSPACPRKVGMTPGLCPWISSYSFHLLSLDNIYAQGFS